MSTMFIRILCGLAVVLGLAQPAPGQTPQGFPDMAGTGQFRDQDTLPGAYRLYQQQPKEIHWLWGAGPQRAVLRRSAFAVDAHEGVADYSDRRPCTDCHREHTKDLHQIRAGITCVQCHRDQPISGTYQYYAAMNPIRRHAYVCAKCHEGATPSFAAYMIHEPNPLTLDGRDTFPLLHYAVWFMVILAGGVFAIFIPYVVLWGLREMIGKLSGGPRHG